MFAHESGHEASASPLERNEAMVGAMYRALKPDWNDLNYNDCDHDLHEYLPKMMSAFDGNGTVSYRRCWEWDHQSVSTSESSKKPPVAAADDQHHRSAGSSRRSSALYGVIGPTLLDIESALAACTPAPTYVDSSAARSTACCSSSPSLRQPHLVINGANVLRQDLVTSVDESSTSFVDIDRVAAKSAQITAHHHHHEEIPSKELPSNAGAAESFLGMSRFKRTATEQRYTMRIRSEVDTVEDGYRWRKYGQKLIKASSHPRSYYRCTDVRCHVKKQVERSSVEAGMVEVTYEGIHLHYQPFPLAITRSLQATTVAPPTSQQNQ